MPQIVFEVYYQGCSKDLKSFVCILYGAIFDLRVSKRLESISTLANLSLAACTPFWSRSVNEILFLM